MKHYLLIICVFISSVTVSSQTDTIAKPKKIKERPKTESVSIINLIATPEKYYGKRVSVGGYMITEFEGTAIYLSREDFDYRIYKNSIFLLIGKGNEYQHFHKEYVTLDGTFIQGTGHMGLFGGMLKDVEYIRERK